MPNGDPRGGFFYPTVTLMMDSYSLCSAVVVIGTFRIKVFPLFISQSNLMWYQMEQVSGCYSNNIFNSLVHLFDACLFDRLSNSLIFVVY